MAQSYKDLVVWQKAIDLTVAVYQLTKQFPKEELFGLVSQMRRASVSIASNIAEGEGRKSKKEFAHFLGISLGSKAELETQLLLCERVLRLRSPLASVSFSRASIPSPKIRSTRSTRTMASKKLSRWKARTIRVSLNSAVKTGSRNSAKNTKWSRAVWIRSTTKSSSRAKCARCSSVLQ